LEKYRPPGHNFRNIFTAKRKIRDRNRWRLLAIVDPGDFPALDRSASLVDAFGPASFDKFSTQKRRTEKTAMSVLDDSNSPTAIPSPGIRRAGTAIRPGYSHIQAII